MGARQLHVDFGPRRTYQRGIWTATMVYAPINLIIVDGCRFSSYALTCSRNLFHQQSAKSAPCTYQLKLITIKRSDRCLRRHNHTKVQSFD
jgi:hypothetical protein